MGTGGGARFLLRPTPFESGEAVIASARIIIKKAAAHVGASSPRRSCQRVPRPPLRRSPPRTSKLCPERASMRTAGAIVVVGRHCSLPVRTSNPAWVSASIDLRADASARALMRESDRLCYPLSLGCIKLASSESCRGVKTLSRLSAADCEIVIPCSVECSPAAPSSCALFDPRLCHRHLAAASSEAPRLAAARRQQQRQLR